MNLFFEPNMPADEIYLILDGKVDMFIRQGESKKFIFQYDKGHILGYFPYSDETHSLAYGQAAAALKLMSYPKSQIQKLISQNPDLTKALLRILIPGNKNFTSQRLQNEKMFALGKLSAGLSHELNNPIASIQRDTTELARLFNEANLPNLVLCNSGLEDHDKSKLHHTLISWMQAERTTGMTSSEIRRREKLWLENLRAWGVQNPDEAAEIFTDYGIDFEEVQFWVEKIQPEKLDQWLHGIQFLLQSQALLKTAQDASERIKSLISAVKNFTHVDHGISTRANLNLVKGIEDTLIILAHKLKKFDVQVTFSKPERPVYITGYASELNQVWTNLIDNALDALEKTQTPKLEIKILPQDTIVSVLISDNGSGIPDEIKSRIFEPFFTTKGMGKGSGLGLDLVNQIIQKHGGKIHVDSAPGHTTFRLEFPNR